MNPQTITASIIPLAVLCFSSILGADLRAQMPATPAPPAANTAPAPLPMPAMVGPLSTAPPATFNAGRFFGTLQVTGILSGMGDLQSNPDPGDHAKGADVSNAQVFLQKTSGAVQFYLQGGAYNIPALGTPLISTGQTVTSFFGPLPQGYLKIAPRGNFSYLAGKLPTLVGAEDTFTFQNMNIERGLLWNQENAVNRGLQVNYSKAKSAASLTWNDGFYSNRYNWLWGMYTYTPSAANSVEFVAGGNLGKTAYSSAATPLYQNNSSIYNVIYTHTAKNFVLQPYVQVTYVPAREQIRVGRGTSTIGGALLGTYTAGPHISLAARGEYIASTGNTRDGSVNLLYGTGSNAFSFTLTPTWRDKAFFARAELSAVTAFDTAPGAAFGTKGNDPTQIRGLLEAGFMF